MPMLKGAFYQVLSFGLLLTLSAQPDEDRLILVSASYGKNVLAICDAQGEVLWKHATEGGEKGHAGHQDLQLLDNGNILFHDNWASIKEINLKKQVVWQYDSHLENGNQGKKVGVHSFDRLGNGETVIVESHVGRIIHVDRAKNITREIPLGEGGRKWSRLMTMTSKGHYLVAAENPGVVTEYNQSGDIVWEYPTKTRVFGALRLRNGNTLICTGNGSSVLEVTPEKDIVWKIGKTDLPDITLGWMTDLQELPNGNRVVGNCHASEKDPQIIELSPDKEVVWSFNEWGLVGDGMACWQILTPEQCKMIRKNLQD